MDENIVDAKNNSHGADGDEFDDDGDQSWVMDSLIGFLKSPIWSSSLNNFMDQMSVVFEPNDIEADDGAIRRRPEYEQIFAQYRALVDQLISSHMTELGISEEQFARACEIAEGVLARKLKSILFEELWAAENFEVFVRLMVRRNVELQLEALDILAQKYGLVYDMFVPIGASPKHFLSEEHVMREAILRSLDDLDSSSAAADDDDDDEENDKRANQSIDIMTNVKRRFSPQPDPNSGKIVDEKDKNEHQDGGGDNGDVEQNSLPKIKDEVNATDSKIDGKDAEKVMQQDKARLEEVRQQMDKKMFEAIQSVLTQEDENANEAVEAEEEKENISTQIETQNNTKSTNSAIEDDGDDDGGDAKSEEKIEPVDTTPRRSEAEIANRAQYLREQRDRIIKLKQKERTEKISKYLVKEKAKLKGQPRPKTARRGGGAGGGADESSASDDIATTASSSSPRIASADIAYRKSLAARLKAEVVFAKK